jgi:hypothetical protein
MTLLQFSADGTFGKKHDFALGCDKVLKIVSNLIGIMERDGYATHVSQRILAYSEEEDDSEPAFDIVSGDES